MLTWGMLLFCSGTRSNCEVVRILSWVTYGLAPETKPRNPRGQAGLVVDLLGLELWVALCASALAGVVTRGTGRMQNSSLNEASLFPSARGVRCFRSE